MHGRMDDLRLYVLFCQRHYKVKFDINPGYVFQTALTMSPSKLNMM